MTSSTKDRDVAAIFAPRFEQRFAQHMGLKLVRWVPDEVELGLDLQRHHQNPTGVVHGGVMLSLLDTAVTLAGCWSASLEERRSALTLSLGTSFIAAATEGHLTVIGRKRGGGRKIYMATAEVIDGDGKLIAIGDGVLRYRSLASDA